MDWKRVTTEIDNKKKSSLARNYDRAAWFYESSADIFSFGQIKACKASQLKHVKPGDNMLYLGVGAGEDALNAARNGINVTCIDISQGMLNRFQRKLDKENLSAELICQNAFEHKRFGHYDAVATNFFLNVFRRDDMVKMMKHAASLVRPQGKFMIADVADPQGNPLSKLVNLLYLKTAMASFCLLGMVPWHENYRYAEFFSEAGLEFEAVDRFYLAKIGPVVYQNIVARKL